MITLDIESEAIEDGDPLLPSPVGVALRYENGDKEYLAWGHPSENNCTFEEARPHLRNLWGEELLTHNGLTFDVPILQHYFQLPTRSPLLTHDTLFLAYLKNPHARSLSLKDLAQDWLGMSTDEQQVMYNWIMANTECRSRKKAGGFISKAPGGMVGTYAMMDVEMTYRLYELIAEGVTGSMLEAYNRERRLAPILADMQNRGVRVDLERLRVDSNAAVAQLAVTDSLIRNILNTPDLDLGKDSQLIPALQNFGCTEFLLTEKGKKPSASSDSLDLALKGQPQLRHLLKMRATMSTFTGTFMLPYVAIADRNAGRLHPSYNQVRNPDGFGTRTGRLSSSRPNFQNQPTDAGPEYPVIRSYFLPEEGHTWVTGDFKSQEPRLTAHFEGGALCKAFQEDPNLDPYLFVGEQAGVTRKEAKIILLGIIYSMGANSLADSLGSTATRATELRNIIRDAIPDVVELDKTAKKRFQMGLPIRTIGGRVYYCEPVSTRDWAYKALNTLIQGSAADQTKEALIYVYENLLPGERILGTVHDEISISCPPERLGAVKVILQEAANRIPCDVPMVMDIGSGTCWSEAK